MGADHDDVLDDPDGGLVWPEIETAISFDEMTISTGASVPVFIVRPAWAHTCGCKSRCELVTVSKAQRNCVRASERGKEAWSVNRELTPPDWRGAYGTERGVATPAPLLAPAHHAGHWQRQRSEGPPARPLKRVNQTGIPSRKFHHLDGRYPIYRELKALGASENEAKQEAGNCHRWWRNSDGAIKRVLTIAYFDQLGVPRRS